MKKILIVLAVLSVMQTVDAQVKSPADAKKAVEAAEEAAQNEKKATKPATWLKLAKAYMDAYAAPVGNVWVGAGKQELQLIMGNEKPSSTENVTLAGEPYTKDVYKNKNLYFNNAGVLAVIEVTKPVYKNALGKALDAYSKAYETDVKKSKEKDVVEGLRTIASKYQEDAMTQYMLGNLAEASKCFERAAAAAATAPSDAVDSMAVYNAGFTAWMAGDNERAKKFFKKSIAINYVEGGEAYAKLADVYTKLDEGENAKDVLEKGFAAYPENQSILIGLINYYITSGENTDRLFELLDEAKKNEPNNASLYYVEGDIHSKLGHKEEAIASYLKSNEINPDYEFGLIGVGILYYNEAIELQDKAASELDDAKYMALIDEFEKVLMNAVEPFEAAYKVSKDQSIKVNIAEYLKNIYYRFRDKDAKFAEGFKKYDEVVKTGVAL